MKRWLEWFCDRWPTWVLGATVSLAAMFVVAVVHHVATRCYFVGDDLSTLWRLRTRPLLDVLFVPLGGQLVPLHRLVAWSVDRLAPMRFEAALGTLVLFHFLAMGLLYRTLQMLRPSRLNVLVVALYTTQVLFGFQLAWFSSGLTRFPYIALSLGAVYAYLSYSRTREQRFLWLAGAAYVGALGFYSKALLVPLYCVAADVARLPWPGESRGARAGVRWDWLWLGITLLFGLLYVVLIRSQIGSAGALNTDARVQLTFQGLAWPIFLHGLFGTLLEFERYAPNPLVALASIGIAVFAVWSKRRAALPLLLLAGLVASNFLFIGLSNRTVSFGVLMAFEHRYYFEVSFLVALFLGMVVHRLREGWSPLRTPWRAPGRVGWSLLFLVAFAAHTTHAFSVLKRTVSGMSVEMLRIRAFVHEVQAGLAELESGGKSVVLLDAPFPRYMASLDFEMRSYSELFAAIGARAKFGDARHATHSIADGGWIVALKTSPPLGAP